MWRASFEMKIKNFLKMEDLWQVHELKVPENEYISLKLQNISVLFNLSFLDYLQDLSPL